MLRAPSRRRIASCCVWTVPREVPSRSAISGPVSPSATSTKISSSRGEGSFDGGTRRIVPRVSDNGKQEPGPSSPPAGEGIIEGNVVPPPWWNDPAEQGREIIARLGSIGATLSSVDERLARLEALVPAAGARRGSLAAALLGPPRR